MFSKKTIVKKTAQIGGFTLLSRMLGIIREVLIVRYLGASALSDVFFTAYKIPNALRKAFAEGALSAAFIPTIVNTMRNKGQDEVIGLMSLGFLLFEGAVLFICALFMLYAGSIIRFIAPGFSVEQVAQAIPMLRILMPFIFFISSSALLAGALQSVGHFFVPAFSPVLLNIVFIGALILSLSFNLPVTYLCWGIIFAGLLQLIMHVVMYFRSGFSLGTITQEDIQRFSKVLTKFVLCLPGVSMMELTLFIDTSFASYLQKGSISLLRYANRFMGIPLGVFAIALSTVLLPHFSRVKSIKRLSFYLLEAAKLVLWVTLPIALYMAFFSEKIFYTIFLSSKFSLAQVYEAASILCAFLIGLFFFSLNKILLNIYYARHETWIPAIIASIATFVNIVLDWFFITRLQGYGLALATSISSMIQTGLFLYILHKKFYFKIYLKSFIDFLAGYSAQLAVLAVPFLLLYYGIENIIMMHMNHFWSHLLLESIGFWVWVGPLCVTMFLLAWYLRKLFNIKLYFLE